MKLVVVLASQDRNRLIVAIIVLLAFTLPMLFAILLFIFCAKRGCAV
jgi:hypothetical protein